MAAASTPLAAAVASKTPAPGSLAARQFRSDQLSPAPAVSPAAEVENLLEEPVRRAWGKLKTDQGSPWTAYFDRRSGRLDNAEGAGVPFVPGRGNGLALRDLGAHAAGKSSVDLDVVEGVARAFLPRVAPLLGAETAELARSQGRSGQVADYLWLIDFDVMRDGLPIEGARVVFRVNHGNLIQLGAENLPPPGVRAPIAKLTVDDAFAAMARWVGDLDPDVDIFLDPGSIHLLPVISAEGRRQEHVPFGRGYGLLKVWQFVFHRQGQVGTWRARVDAASGEVVEFVDLNQYADAQVTGGAYKGDRPTPIQTVPMPFADVTSGGPFTDSGGIYNYTSGTVTSALNGRYVRIVDNCGSISQTGNAGTSGSIAFGTSPATDCVTPGSGGAGNTNAARTQYYMVNRAKETGRGWLPANAWLNGQLTVNVNLNQTCNAYWSGSTLNFFRSGGGCDNTGELPGVSLHEWGHGMDSNDGNGGSPDNGTGETYGDFSGALSTHDSCLGNGFDSSGIDCGGYGDACTSCSGVRDIDWAKHISNTPHTVANFTQTFCPLAGSYVGPCGRDAINKGVGGDHREGHCESYVSSEALWDFAARDLQQAPGSALATGAAWAVVDRLWYFSRSTASAAFQCNTTPAVWTSDGCNTGSNWKVLRAADDDDGNLANGTPHSCDLYAAFNRHGIACTTDAGANTCLTGCTVPTAPALSGSGNAGNVDLSWTSSGGGIIYDVYRNENGCNAGFARIADNVGALAFSDTAISPATTYYYQVTAQTASEACVSAPSNCIEVKTCSPASPTGLAAVPNGDYRIDLSWAAAAGASEYRVFRATTSGGPYTQIGTVAAPGTSFVDSPATEGIPYYYVVRAASGGCLSSASNQATATATGACSRPPTFAGLATAATPNTAACAVNLGWAAATQCGGFFSGVYNIYRSTTQPFTPTPANRVGQVTNGATTFTDTSGVFNGTTYYYIVRAATSLGVEESNTVTLAAAPFGVLATTNFYGPQNFDSCAIGSLCGWTTSVFSGNTDDWIGRQDCAPTHSGAGIFRYGGTTGGGPPDPCTKNYGNGTGGINPVPINTFARPFGAGGFAVPPGTRNVRADFWHRWAFEPDYDGAFLRLSVNGTTFPRVSNLALLSGGYNGIATNSAGWTGVQATFVNSVANLDMACDVASGSTDGCAGKTIHVGFSAYADSAVNDDGWFIDDVRIYGSVPASCSPLPSPLQYFTATAKANSSPGYYNRLEWQTPATGACSSIRVCMSTSPPAPTSCVTPLATVACGGNDTRGSYTHSPFEGVGTTYYYSAFVDGGGGQLSARKTARGKTQTLGNTPPSMWTYYSGGASLSPPGIGSIFALANDRVLHSVNPGDGFSTTSGLWPTGWKPFAMNAPAQQRPPVFDFGGMKTVLIGSQDGRAYAVNGTTGAQIWMSPQLGGMLQAAPSAVLTAFGGSKNLAFVGTRDATADNKFYALNLADGTIAANWPFDNGGGVNGIGIINSMAEVDYGTSRIYFTSRARSGGSNGTVWCLSFAGPTPALCAGTWPRAIGDVDGSAIRVGNRLYVGTNAGKVVAIDATTGADVWTFDPGNLVPPVADGPVKGFVFPRYGTSPLELVFSTNTRIWNIVDNGLTVATAPGWPVDGLTPGTIAGPSIPLAVPFSNYIYFGSTSGNLHQVDATNPLAAPKVAILPDSATTGAPSLDTSTGLVHVGSLTGAINAVAVPLP